jgi:hypothetical protein
MHYSTELLHIFHFPYAIFHLLVNLKIFKFVKRKLMDNGRLENGKLDFYCSSTKYGRNEERIRAIDETIIMILQVFLCLPNVSIHLF